MPVTRWTQLPQQFHAVAAEHPGSVLLQTARFDAHNQRSLLFLDPLRTITASKREEVPALFREIEAALVEGLHVAGFLGYECGYHFEPTSERCRPDCRSFRWRGSASIAIPSSSIMQAVASKMERRCPSRSLSTDFPRERLADYVSLQRTAAEYSEKIRRIKEYIRAGETYQVNFTDRVELTLPDTPIAAFGSLLRHQPVAYSAFLNIPGHQILSVSGAVLPY